MAIAQGKGFAVPEMQLPILSSLGLVKTDNALGFYKVFDTLAKDSLVAQLEASGKVQTTPQQRFGMWFSANKQRNMFKVTADATVTNSGAVTVTVAAASHTGASNELSPVAVGLFFVDNSTGVEYEVRAVNKTTNGAHTATIAPTTTGVTTEITVADSEFISTGRQSVQESSFQQDGEYSAWSKRFNETSIIRTNKQYSDLTSMVKMEYNGQDYMSIDQDSINQQHVDAKEFQIVEGAPRNNVQSTGNKNTNAQGILPLVKQYGTTLDGGGSGATLNDAFFENLSRAIVGNGFSKSYSGLADHEAIIKIQKFLKSQADVNVNLNINNGDRSEIQVIFDYSTLFTYYGIDFSFKEYDYWNVNRLAGADVTKSYKANQILLFPEGGAMTADGWKDYLQLRVLDNNLSTDEGYLNHFDTDGALFGKNTTRNAQISLTSYMGVDITGVEGFIYTKLA